MKEQKLAVEYLNPCYHNIE